MFSAVIMGFRSVKVSNVTNLLSQDITVKNGDSIIEINSISSCESYYILNLKEDINIKAECFVTYENITVKAVYRELYNTEEFNSKFCTNMELGNFYSKNNTIFKVWSPAAEDINLLLYKNGDSEINEEPLSFPMKEENGVWSISINQDLNGLFYTYKVKVYDTINEAGDPYARAVGINGIRSAIIDFNLTTPEGFDEDTSPEIENFTDAIIYETSIRDISMHPDSGVYNKGKFLGLAEENTRSSRGLATALNHIIELGVTHVQIMPMYDFSYSSTDEKNPVSYNWGYDPQNYNVPEGSYSTDPYNPIKRISELKTMVQVLHKNNLCVNMDVVYNHVFNLKTENLEKIFPGYYFRFYDDGTPVNGSSCSNDTASEHVLMRKFIVDSVYYLAKEYHLDGFRFDLMGLHDVTTMNSVREKLNTLGRPIMLYGEGWILNTLLPENLKANQQNSCKMPHIGHFNDIMRNAVRGNVFIKEEKGFSSGKENMEDTIKYCVAGCTDYTASGMALFQTPDQSINYVSSHDNNTLWDKLKISNPEDSEEDLKAMQKLSNAIVLTSQGIAFLHSGAEFCRTKYGIEDSVKASDEINWMDWNRKAEYLDVFNYYKGLIRLRKEHAAFKMNTVEQIRKHLEFLSDIPKNTIGFILKNYANNDIWKDILVIYNANREEVRLNIPEGYWNIVVDKHHSGVETIRSMYGTAIEVESISVTVLYREIK